MAAPSQHCRVKLYLQEKQNKLNVSMWYSVDFQSFKSIRDLKCDISEKLNLGEQNPSLYIQDVILPEWEICARVFRDGDDVYLKFDEESDERTSESRYTPQTCSTLKRKLVQSSPITENQHKYKKKRKSRSTHDADETVQENVSLAEVNNQCPVSETALNTNSLQAQPKSQFDEESTSDSENQINENKPNSKNRSAVLTPAELELIADMESIPKAKRRRKRKKKKSKVEKKSAEHVKEPAVESLTPASLKTDYKGKKMVFYSDQEEGHNGREEYLSQSAEKVYDEYMCVVKESKQELPSELQVSPSVQSKLSEKIQSPQGQSRRSKCTASQSETPDPAVYKRDKLKLRATLSPAVFEELLRSSDNGAANVNAAERVDNDQSLSVFDKNNTVDTDRDKKNYWQVTQSAVESLPPADRGEGHYDDGQYVSRNACNTNGELRQGNRYLGKDREHVSLSEVTVSPLMRSKGTDKYQTAEKQNIHSPKGQGQKNRCAENKSKKPGPKVYKREKLKLRATLSPAVFEELVRSRESGAANVNESDAMHDVQSPLVLNKNNNVNADRNKMSRDREHLSQSDSAVTSDSYNMMGNDFLSSTATDASDIKDYSMYGLLHDTPKPGNHLAFKMLEMSDNYNPVVSGYKEGKVMEYEPKSHLIKVKLLLENKGEKKTPGVFDVYIEDEDGQALTNVLANQDEIVINYGSLMDVRLISA